ncbi:hypothetical protein D9757_007536 [Collybiopsis confluens]|uniref:Uncharacterized protein n=1 Tax=Collybiopsis confluens TaxID=2823264 RepID=A0A8H5FLQ5_9AGAR|nr:hypothetical protein D9757_014814 [Collybiopsis confluens]KAF5381910.1 hypothetical protein D9757_007536 [Collybiopsis confluens]
MSDKPLPKTDTIFALALASLVKSAFNVQLGNDKFILTSPLIMRGIAAGNLVYPQMTNYLIYKFADSLQYSDNPSYYGSSAGSYMQQLESYISWVKPPRWQSRDVSVEAALALAEARDNAQITSTRYAQVEDDAAAEWAKVQKDFPGVEFFDWADRHYPALKVARGFRTSTHETLIKAMNNYFGEESEALTGYTDGIYNALNGVSSLPGFNQEGMINEPILLKKAIDSANSGRKPSEAEIAQSTVLIPEFTIPDYTKDVQAWMTAASGGAPRDKVIPFDIEAGKTTTWEDYGFKTVPGGSGSGQWPFFHAAVLVNNAWVDRKLNTDGREDAISVQIAMINFKKDVPDIKKFERAKDAPTDVLSSKYGRIIAILVGYDVELRVKFAHEMREEVNSIYEEVKATGGRMSILGFQVSAGKEETPPDHVVTKFDHVRWNRSEGTMVLVPNSGQVYPTILGALAQRFV